MKIRNKILIYFSTTVIALTAISLTIIYILFSEYREEEFQQQQNEKIHTTIKLIEKFKRESATISYLIDQQDINDFYDEKLLVYDSNKN
jgi:two-component system, OmpR family, sensor histidine kinase ArlS